MHIQLRQSSFYREILRFKGCVQFFIEKIAKNENQIKWRRQYVEYMEF